MAFGNGPRIVTDGLVLALDASDRNSYVSGSSTWFDVSGNGNSGSLTNGPTFSSNNGGAIVFDGVNDYINLSNATSIWTEDFTVQFCTKLNTIANQFIFSSGPYSNSGDAGTNFWFGGGSSINFTIHFKRTDSNSMIGYSAVLLNPYLNTNLYTITFTNSTRALNIYQNNILLTASTVSSVALINNMQNGWRIGNSTNAYNVNGPVYFFKVYNRALSTSEVLQNYNATKTRFGL